MCSNKPTCAETDLLNVFKVLSIMIFVLVQFFIKKLVDLKKVVEDNRNILNLSSVYFTSQINETNYV